MMRFSSPFLQRQDRGESLGPRSVEKPGFRSFAGMTDKEPDILMFTSMRRDLGTRNKKWHDNFFSYNELPGYFPVSARNVMLLSSLRLAKSEPELNPRLAVSSFV